ncbi:MAG TPA: lytic transglycosylase domain-containing protein [Burkholderiaceae bacterium]|nr:lytic transglycosylase domain-containing protein [Burkholderiaceae bacterium]
MKILGRRLLAVAVVLLPILQQPAHADVWGYIDAKGVAHFATERLDDRYELFYRGGQSFDTSANPPVAEELPRAVAVPTARPKLLAFFEISPHFKVVKHHMRDAARTHNIDYELLQALIATESGFDSTAVSPKGAVGLMQIMPGTAERYGVASDAKMPVERKLTDPKVNIRTGTRYLSDLIKMFPGQLELALAAYNAGEGAVQRAGNKIPNYKETQAYVKTVMQIYTMLKPPVPVAERRRLASRVRMELPGAALGEAAPGGARGRGNMIAPLSAAPVQPEFKIERE